MTSAAYGSLGFAEQIDFFRRKVNVPTQAWTDVYAAGHEHSFMVAGARGEVLTDLRGAVDRFIREGRTLADFRRDFDAVVARTGWAYNGGRNWRTRIIYETNLRQSYNAGREAQIEQVKATRPYGLYRHGGSAEPRQQHLAWDGIVLPLDDPWWNTHSPQNGWGCSCKKFTLSARDVERLGLTVRDQAPAIEWEEKIVGGRGPTPRRVKVPKGIDPGFEYRPGSNQIQAMTPRPLAEPPSAYLESPAPKPPMPAPKPISTEPLPAAATDAELAQGFLDAVGGVPGRAAFVYEDVTGERLPMSAQLFMDHRGRWKIRKEGRDARLHILVDTIRDPDEIWIAWQSVKSGPDVLRRRYLRVLPGEEGGIAVFEWDKDGWSETTVFHVTDAIARRHGYRDARDYIEHQRVGVRIYAREVGT